MEYIIFEKLAEAVKANKKAALVSIVEEDGSTPGKQGFMMAVFDDGSTLGTIGGGNFEATVRSEALKYMKTGESKFLHFKLNEDGGLHMQCGGSASVFIKVFGKRNKLIIAGGGHIALELSRLGNTMDFHTVIFEDREEYGNNERFPGCEIVLGDIGEKLRDYSIDDDCYVVIVTRGHECDAAALKSAIGRGAAYVGMIGSRKKVRYVMDRFENEGYSKEELEKVYAPIGLCLGGDTPAEIALGIISEIMLIKNNGTLKHMKDAR
ncbi:MAG: XdhC family protein [Caulobacteraceae bacterium]